ncbi:hypothetical protein GJU40_09900 [Bacillus lacus]|uniref:Uncharacterized protein n=1 Tax=Metabacillus lacus TaxID=1983721 RepID=A0A7X2LZY0_9BACI|nr:hypothetical protein [Metabacillus lacus]MRX72457.1 hypothetical protein [Metabacillus lacus]
MQETDADQYTSASTPHVDGKDEGIINDPSAAQSTTMGITVDTNREFSQKSGTFQGVHLRPDSRMSDFSTLMKGKKTE